MMEAQGLDSLFPMEDLSVMGHRRGAAEISPPEAPHRAKRRPRRWPARAEALVTIDSPDFCLRVAAIVKAAQPGSRRNPLCRALGLGLAAGAGGEDGQGDRPRAGAFAVRAALMTAAGMTCDFVGHPVVAEPLATSDERHQLDGATR